MTLSDNDLRYDTALYIRELQTCLREIAYVYDTVPRVEVDGVFGRETEVAVRAAQELFELPVTGTVDFLTWTVLCEAYRSLLQQVPLPIDPFAAAFCVLKRGDSGDIVGIVQWMICALARRCSSFQPLPSTGVFEQATEDAVKEIQRLCGLTVTGEIDLATWNALVGTYTALGVW